MTDTDSTVPEPTPAPAEAQPAPAAAPAAPAAAPPAAAQAAPPPDAAPAKKGGGAGFIVLLLLVLILVAGGGGAYAWFIYLKHPLPAQLSSLKLPFLPHAQPAPGTPPVGGPKVATAPMPAPVSVAPAPAAPSAQPPLAVSGAPAVAAAPVQEDAAGLLADAQRNGLPRDQVASLSAANSKLAAAGTAAPDQVNAIAISMARNEAAVLSRNAAARQHEVEATLGDWGGGGGAIAAVRRAHANLNAATAAVGRSSDAAGAIDAARRAVAAYPAFVAAYTAATRQYAPAKRAQFWAIAGQCRTYASGINSYAANLSPGGAFATSGRRAAYREAQDNVARARGLVSDLDSLADYERGTDDLGALAANLNRVQGIRASLAELYNTTGNLYAANK